MMRRNLFVQIFVLMLVLLFAGAGLSATKRPSTVAELALYNGVDRQQILEEGAKKEGKLLFLYLGDSDDGGWPCGGGLSKKYPYIKVEFWRAAGALIPRILEEYKTKNYLCDIVEGVQTTRLALQEAGITTPFYSPNLAYMQDSSI